MLFGLCAAVRMSLLLNTIATEGIIFFKDISDAILMHLMILGLFACYVYDSVPTSKN